ncbi:MAG: hypothetical protein VZR23_01315 [Lachnospiraceae bacterium]|nr:hypothetical protein [Lachnospiraceae bacterium]
MNSIKNKILISIFSLCLLIGFGGTAAYAASTAKGGVNGSYTHASSTISKFKAQAFTSYDSRGSVSVSSTYSYINIDTLTVRDMKGQAGHYDSAQVSFDAPNNCHSVRIVSSHSVSAYNQTWTARTSAVY